MDLVTISKMPELHRLQQSCLLWETMGYHSKPNIEQNITFFSLNLISMSVS